MHFTLIFLLSLLFHTTWATFDKSLYLGHGSFIRNAISLPRRKFHHTRASTSLPVNWVSAGCLTDSTSNRALSGYSYASSSLTPASCISTCAGKGYVKAGVEFAQECYCSNTIITSSTLSTGQVSPSSDCSMPCSGDSSQSCGNGGRIQVYSYTAPLPSGWTLKGCYTDDTGNRALQGYSTTSSTDTPASCITTCASKGYSFGGVEFGQECYCSNLITASSTTGVLASSSDCSMACSGDSSQTCGNGGRIQIYQSSAASSSLPATSSTPTTTSSSPSSSPTLGSWVAKGCYSDDTSNRALQGNSLISTTNTPIVCASFCLSKGYSLAGVEYGSECYCSNALTTSATTGQLEASSDCSMLCSGDASTTCGNGGRIFIYTYQYSTATSPLPVTTTTSSPSSTPTSSWVARGCYNDDTSDRALKGSSVSTSSNTPGSCNALCLSSGYILSGVEFGSECYCSNTLTTSSTTGQLQSSSDCSMPCSGDSSQICGNGGRIFIYSYQASSTTTTSSAPSPSPTSWKRLGCFTDNGSSRALSGPSTTSQQNSPNVCSNYCTNKGYTLSGVEYGQECYCGNSINSSGTGQPAPDLDCSMSCAGTSSSTCGSSYRVEIYASPSYLTSSASIWSLKQDSEGGSFFNAWTFFNYADPTHGTVDYQDAGSAWSQGLVSINGAGNAIMRVDTTPVVPANRKSIRIQTSNQYTGGVLIADVVHMPSGCGTWPAFWSVGPSKWPQTGEIDIIEGVHAATQNLMSIHTKAGCTMPPNYNATGSLAFSGAAGMNCDAVATGNTGCGLRSSTANNYGVPFNNNGGGVYAMVWNSAGISVYFFPRGSIPSDITLNAPQPDWWGIPQARWPASTCNPSQFFSNHVAVFDTTLCGDWAGSSSVWSGANQAGQGSSCQSMTGYSTCQDYVRANSGAFSNAYWEVKSVKLYQ